jgi:ABC-type uncharacterized transport system substrate-binding protein
MAGARQADRARSPASGNDLQPSHRAICRILPAPVRGRWAYGVQASEAAVDSDVDIENALGILAREPGGGFVVLPDTFTGIHRDRIVSLAAHYRLPAVYPFRWFPEIGGLLSYGIDSDDMFRRAASYVDRILKGAQPGDLPVQAPAKYELIINLKTARTLGLDVPPTLLAIADEVIE